MRKGPGSPSTHKAEWHLDPDRSWGLPHKPRLPGFGWAIGCEPGIQREEVMERSKPEGHLGFCQATRKHPSHLFRACLEGLWQPRASSAGSPVLGRVHRVIRWATTAPYAGAEHGVWSQTDSAVLGELARTLFNASSLPLRKRLLPSFCRWGYWEVRWFVQACIDGGWGPSQELAFLTSAASLWAVNPRPLFFLDSWVFLVGRACKSFASSQRVLQEAPELLPPPLPSLSRPLWAVVSRAWQGPCRLGFIISHISCRFVTSRTFCLSVNQEQPKKAKRLSM